MTVSDRIKEINEQLSLITITDTSLPNHVYSYEELVIGYSLIQFLARGAITETSPQVIRKNLEKLLDNNEDLVNFGRLIVDEIGSMDCEINLKESDIRSDLVGNWLQQSLEKDDRKSLAVNYTIGISDILSHFKLEKLEINSIVDPYCGSGRLIDGILILMEHHSQIVEGIKIRINDLMPLAVLNAFVILKTKYNYTIRATIGNGFEVSGKYDLVIINPPFTRSQLITENIKKSLDPLKNKYSEYLTGQAGLHLWALFHSFDILSNGGQLISVLPMSTISSRYSQGLKTALIKQFSGIDILSYQFDKAHSQGSELKEMVLHGYEGNNTIKFLTINNKSGEIARVYTIGFDKVIDLWNWSSLFRNSSLLSVMYDIIANVPVVKLAEEYEIVRGIEMYGPNFFFFPNKYYRIDCNDETIQVIHKKSSMENYSISKKYFTRMLRKPSIYSKSITPNINEFCLTIQDEISNAVASYLETNKNNAKVALRRFGDDWYRHPTMQIDSKDPFGHIFLIDKLDLDSTPTLAYYTDELLPSTKNFYVLKSSYDIQKTKFLAAWLNSSLYLVLYMGRRREIGGTYGRLQIIDYSYNPLLLDLDQIEINETAIEILLAFDNLRNMELPSLVHQVRHQSRMELDRLFVEYFDLELSVEDIHELLDLVFEELMRR